MLAYCSRPRTRALMLASFVEGISSRDQSGNDLTPAQANVIDGFPVDGSDHDAVMVCGQDHILCSIITAFVWKPSREAIY